jgi:hypothetical protein
MGETVGCSSCIMIIGMVIFNALILSHYHELVGVLNGSELGTD